MSRSRGLLWLALGLITALFVGRALFPGDSLYSEVLTAGHLLWIGRLFSRLRRLPPHEVRCTNQVDGIERCKRCKFKYVFRQDFPDPASTLASYDLWRQACRVELPESRMQILASEYTRRVSRAALP